MGLAWSNHEDSLHSCFSFLPKAPGSDRVGGLEALGGEVWLGQLAKSQKVKPQKEIPIHKQCTFSPLDAEGFHGSCMELQGFGSYSLTRKLYRKS